MNKKTKALTSEQYKEIIGTIRAGYLNHRPNESVAMALQLEANLGLRISDIIALKLNDIVRDSDRWRLDNIEQKTQKLRTFTVPNELYNYIKQYCIDNEIKSNETIFHFTEREVQKQLKFVVDYLGYEGIGTHSFRKYFATRIYENNDHNIVLVQTLLQHSNTAITQRYIGISSDQINNVLKKNLQLV